jgi:hypothetical protein
MTSRSTLDLHTLGFAICAYKCKVSWQDPQNVVRLLQRNPRAAELEMRTAEEPLRSDSDVAGPKAQVLRRIEELDAREREREELVAEFVPAMEARGYYTGAVKAAMGG